MKKIQQKVVYHRETARRRTYGVLRRHPRLARVYLAMRRSWQRLHRWWQRNDRRYGMKWRLANGAMAGVIVATVCIPVVEQIMTARAYALDADTLKLVGATDGRLTSKLTYDAETATYQFNKDAVKSSDDNPFGSLQSAVGEADQSLYALDVPTDAQKGVTYQDINSGLSFSLAPQYATMSGRNVDGHLVFPLAGGTQVVYTLKHNGLKEDIVVQRVTSDSMSFHYSVKLPKTLAMKLIPGGDGAVGIYSGDPTLFGQMEYASDKDRQAMETARENAAKNYLVFGLPAPVVKNLHGDTVGSAKFSVDGDTLTVTATGLSGQKGPITIDPSVVVTSTSDFQTGGNNDSNIDFSTAGQLTRGAVTGGSVGSWTTNTSTMPGTTYAYGTTVYNGRIYTVAGYDASLDPYTIRQAINSDGSIGASVTEGSSYTQFGQAVAYNGYLYSLGGGTSTPSAGVAYAPINASTGAVGTWKNTTAMSMPRDIFSAVVYNGYLYAIGGGTDEDLTATVEYAPINANGTLGSWTTTTSLPTALKGTSAVVYNGYMYVLGGTDGSTYDTDVHYAVIRSDGTLGSWMTAASFTNGRACAGVIATNGYLYLIGGTNGSSYYNDVQYAPINANGTLGQWNATSSFTTGRAFEGVASYNGYLYLLGGAIDFGGTAYEDIQYAKIDPPGQIASVDTAASTGTGTLKNRSGASTFAYNGYLYTFGGTYSSASQSASQKVIVNPDGSLGNITNTTAMGTATSNYAFASYNGYVYVIGGTDTSGTAMTTVQYAGFNSSGTLNWGTTTALSAGVAYQSAVAYGGYLFLLGTSGSGASNTIQAAPINDDGTLGSWTTQTQTLATARVKGALLAYNGTLYVVGGQNGTPTTSYASIESASINTTSPGSAATVISSSFSTSSNSLTTSRAQFGAFIANGYMYVIGGTNVTGGTSTDQSTGEFARIKTDGTLDSWKTAGLGATVSGLNGIVVTNGKAYSIAPSVSGTRTTTVMRLRYNNGGTGVITGSGTNGVLDTTNDLSSIYTSGIVGHKVFAAKGYLFIVGGNDGTGNKSGVYSAKINDDGSLGTWTATSSLTQNRGNAGLGVIGNYVYDIAGNINSGKSSSIEYASINNDGTLSTWTVSNYSISGDRASPSVATYGDYLYILGGNGTGTTVYNDVQYMKAGNGEISADAGCGSAVCTTSSFTTGRYTAMAVGYNNYMYIIGGKYDSSGSQLRDAQVAPINSDGSLGAWSPTSPMMYSAAVADIVSANGYIIVIGGINTGAALNAEQYVPILSNGQLGNWQSNVNVMSGKRSGNSIEYYNGYVYTVGGQLTGTNYADVQYGTLNVQPRVGYYSKLIDLGSSSNVTSVSYNGQLPYGDASVTYRAAGSNGVFGSTNYTNTINGSGTCTGNLKNTRYLFIMVAVNDSTGKGNGATYPDINGYEAGLNGHLDDITVNYNTTHPPPDIRLRGGKTLQNGNLSAFDTCQE